MKDFIFDFYQPELRDYMIKKDIRLDTIHLLILNDILTTPVTKVIRYQDKLYKKYEFEIDLVNNYPVLNELGNTLCTHYIDLCGMGLIEEIYGETTNNSGRYVHVAEDVDLFYYANMDNEYDEEL